MPALTSAELDEPGHLLRLATLRADGSPFVVPMWFVRRDDLLVVTARAASSWWKDIERDERVCASIDEDALPYRKVTLPGRMRVLHGLGADGEWRDIYRAICLRYQNEDDADSYMSATIDVPRVLLGLPFDPSAPDVTTWRVPREGEDSRGIWAERYWSSAR